MLRYTTDIIRHRSTAACARARVRRDRFSSLTLVPSNGWVDFSFSPHSARLRRNEMASGASSRIFFCCFSALGPSSVVWKTADSCLSVMPSICIYIHSHAKEDLRGRVGGMTRDKRKRERQSEREKENKNTGNGVATEKQRKRNRGRGAGTREESCMTRLSLIAVGRAIRVFQFSGGRRPQAISSTTAFPHTHTHTSVYIYIYIYGRRR